ncbi:MAG: 4Fe-4S dicluster domain-containing protein, partial [Actinobacteria bacterium]
MEHVTHDDSGVGRQDRLFSRASDTCSACWACIRHCPTHAIRSVDGAVSIAYERCVKCGACVTECGSGTYTVRDDTPALRALLAEEKPVVALLASEYIAALHPRRIAEVEAGLEAMGFSAVETTVLGEELVAAAYEQVHARTDSLLPRLRSTCPVTVEWVQRFYPELTGALVPLVPPYVAQTRLIRELYAGEVAVAYVSPCWARKDEVLGDELPGAPDVAVGFDELERLLAENPAPRTHGTVPRRPHAAKQLSGTDGFPRRTLFESTLADRDVVTVRGLHDVDRLLAAIVRGETAPGVVDMLCCEGCIDGPAVNRSLSVFAKRTIDAAERERQPPPAVDSRTLLSALPAVPLARRFDPSPTLRREPT